MLKEFLGLQGMLSLGYIKIFGSFQPKYAYKRYAYKNKGCRICDQNHRKKSLYKERHFKETIHC